MLFEFTLDNDILGPLVINEPDGWRDTKLKLERDKNFKSLVEYFDGSFIFYGDNGIVNGGIDYIKEVELTQGFDAKLTISIRLSLDGYTFEDVFEGLLNLSGIIAIPDNKIQVPIIPNDFWTKFINRLDTPVDIQSPISLDDESVDVFDSINLKLTSQKIQKKYDAYQKVSDVILESDWVVGQYLGIGMDTIVLDELKELFDLPTFPNPEKPVWILSCDEPGFYQFDLRVEASKIYYTISGTPPACTTTRTIDSCETEIEFYIQKNEDAPILFTVTNSPLVLTNRSSTYSYNGGMNMVKGDIVRIYGSLIGALNQGDISNLFIYSQNNTGTVKGVTVDLLTCTTLGLIDRNLDFGLSPSSVEIPTYFKVTAQTVYEDTNAFSFLIHDLAGQICDRIISQDQTFYSEHLGGNRTIYRQYDADGCAWKYVASKGLQIRQYSLIEKPFFMSFNQWWKGVNPVLCLGLGYEELNGQQVIRIEKQEDFYDQSGVSCYINNVRQISRLYDQDVIFKTVKVGYSKWQSEDISGIDDAQTKHTYATRLQKSGTEINIESDFIAASLAIETTRRTTKVKSADYKFDNDTFLIAINPIPIDVSPETSPDVNDYEPELDENFSSITNLLNSETRYNSRITPARNLIRWIRYISGCLQSYVDSKFKFVSGEGNYDMTSDMIDVSDGCNEEKLEVSEKEDIPVYNDPLHLSLSYEIVIPLEWEDYLLIRNNRKKAIAVSQTTSGHAKFFIDTLDYELVKGIATIKAWPVEYFDIQVIDTTSNQNVCYVVPGDCEDAYLTESNFELIAEDGDCLILE